MAWIPVSGVVPQFSKDGDELASGYYLKFYEDGTTNVISMATDATGGTTLTKAKLNTSGYPISDPGNETTVFIPHLEEDYRAVLYANETDADADTTSNAIWNVPAIAIGVVLAGDATDITLRATTIEIQDDYDRSPLFTDGDGFTAGAGPHVITTPAGWTPSNSDFRVYRADSSSIYVALIPTATTASTFTLGETLLSDDTIFIGDDTNSPVDPHIQFVADFSGGKHSYVYDSDDQVTNRLDLDANLTSGVLTSIGPTGSGATYIWTAMDNIPLTATYIDITCDLSVRNNAGAIAEISLEGRDDSGTSLVKIGHAFIRATGATDVETRTTGYARFKLSAANIFHLEFTDSVSTTRIASATLAGFGN